MTIDYKTLAARERAELTGAALDWAVAKLERPDSEAHGGVVWLGTKRPFSPSVSWADGGPIIERESITVSSRHDGWWRAWLYNINDDPHTYVIGPTALIAAMRCYVASRLGDEVEIPEELLK